MQTITNYIPRAKKCHAVASSETKMVLEEIFGQKCFLPIKDRVKTLADACEITGDDPNDKKYHEGRPKNCAFNRLETIIKALGSEHEKLSFKNSNQKKWFPYFIMTEAGFRFGDSNYDDAATDAGAGSGLCLPTEELSNYAGTQFIEDWNILMAED